uniref:Transposase (Putative), gypsy type n=1 Tax=Tanacetum cinerariifolium TaxID=118510 RepID=A0A6L2NGR7_TANCI|nr:hypothetical protein [Tanacetum cinerariifolium]
MVRDSVQLETAVNTISHEYLLEFASEYVISEMLHPKLPGPGDRIVDFPKGKVGWMSFSKRPGKNTPQCYTKPLDSLKNWNNRFFWVDECVFPAVVDWRTNASKDGMPANGTYSVKAVKTGSRPRAPHELPLLTLTAPRVIKMDEPAAVTDSSSVPSTIERSPLDFAHEAEASDRETAAPEMPPPEDVPVTTAPGTDQAVETVAVEPSAFRKSRKRGVPADVSDPDPLAFADAPSPHPADVAQSSQGVAVAGDPKSENVSSPAEVGSPRNVYRPKWGVTNGSLLDTPEACQDLVDHAAPPGYFFELRHMHNEDFLWQYNINLARQVAMGSQLRLRFEQEAKLLRKSVAQVARRDQRIQARESKIKNLEALLETEAGMKRAAEEKSDGLSQELERMRAQFSELQVSHERLSQQVDALQQQMDARLDALSVDFDEELYPHMLTAIAGRMWVIGHGLRLVMMKCAESLKMRQAFADVVSAGVAKGMSEGLKHGVEHGYAQRTLEGLRDAPMDVIMAALYLESDTGGDAPQFIRDLRPSSSQLTIPAYPDVRDPRNPWACKEEIGLADAIAASISRAEQKKKSRIVCRTHGVGSAHHARSDRVPVSAPIVVPQGLALLLVDAATQTESDDG